MKERITRFYHILKTHMKNHIVSIVTGIIVLAIAGGFAVHAYSDPNAADRARIVELEKLIEQSKKEYADLAEKKEKNESYCTLSKNQSQQMAKLNGLNNQRRDEVRFLQSKLDPTQPQQ